MLELDSQHNPNAGVRFNIWWEAMTESITAFDKFILESAEQYLHTVVLIDDRIYESKSGNVAAPLAKPQTGLRKAALKSATIASDNKGERVEESRDSDKPEEVSFHDVQNSFAKKRIVCSLPAEKGRIFQPTLGGLQPMHFC